MPLPVLPPAYQLIAVEHDIDAFERAVRVAPRGLDDGTVYWTDRGDRLTLAVVLEPDAPADETLQAVYVMTVAAGDALGSLLPPIKPVAFAWPGHILLDGASLGRVRAVLAPVVGEDAVPPWLVLGLDVAVASLGADLARCHDRTSLGDEGAGEITVIALTEHLGRHFLHWTGRWLDDGLAPVRAAWNQRCFGRGEVGELALGEERLAGPIVGLAADGAFLIGGERLRLAAHLDSLR